MLAELDRKHIIYKRSSLRPPGLVPVPLTAVGTESYSASIRSKSLSGAYTRKTGDINNAQLSRLYHYKDNTVAVIYTASGSGSGSDTTND